MNQSNRTLTYVGIAIVAVAIAYFSMPAPVEVEPSTANASLLLFPEFKDPRKAASLDIKRFNEDKLSFDEFSIVEKDQVWTIPSHENYPADAKDQMVKAASLLSDLRVTSIETDAAQGQQRERYGLMEPTIDNFQKSGAASLGMRVTVRDPAKKALADLIIGKEVPGKPDQRYVMLPGQNRIATIKVDTSKLSTKFSDWIETDLLKLGSIYDVSTLALHDYSFDIERGPQERARMKFDRPADQNAWRIVDLKTYDDEKSEYIAALPAADEELDSAKVDDMRSALNELKIVNVEKKPAKFRDSLFSKGQINLSQETARSLQNRGFFLVQAGSEDDPQVALVSTDGELTVTMKDGVEYVLRFGAVADFDKDGNEKPKDSTTAESSKTDTAKTDEAKKDDKSGDEKKKENAEDKGGINLHRYLFVVAQYNEDMIEKPVLEKLPEAPGTEKPAGKTEEKPAEGSETKPEEKPAERSEKTPGEKSAEESPGPKPENGEKPAGEKDSNKKPAEEKPAGEKPTDMPPAKDEEKPADEQSATRPNTVRFVALQNDAAKPDDAKPGDAKSNDAKSDESKPTEQKQGEAAKPAEGEKPADPATPAEGTKPAEGEKPAAVPAEGEKPAVPAAPQAEPAKPSPEEAAKNLEAERKRIEAENKTKQEEYDNKVKDAKKKVKELNERFADWYYVIPEDVYKKIHLSRADVIKKKTKPAGETAPGEVKPSDIKGLPPTLGTP